MNTKDMEITVISMKESIERRNSIHQQLQFLPFSFLDAIDGKNILAKDYFFFLKRLKGRAKRKSYISPGELGCALSHLEAYKRFLNSEKKWLLILEDDIILNSERDFDLVYSILGNKKYVNYINILGGQEGLKRPKLITTWYHKYNDIKVINLPSPYFGFFLYRTCSYLLSRNVVSRLINLYNEFCYISDDWGHIALNIKVEGFSYCEIFKHPIDLKNSLIESERN